MVLEYQGSDRLTRDVKFLGSGAKSHHSAGKDRWR